MVKPYGTWPSPITSAAVAAQGLRLSSVALDDGDVYWVEGRPLVGGRGVVVRRTPDGVVADAIPAGFNARTRVHEYGGGAVTVRHGSICFSNFSDQRIYLTDRAHPTPVPVTPEGAWCYADGVIDESRRRLICVREDHTDAGREPLNAIVAVALDDPSPSPAEVLTSGHDFYATPRLNADATMLAWLCWNHPQMPWDGTELWVADVAADGRLERPRRVAGGATESIYQPGWLPDGSLCFASDRSQWWRLYRAAPEAGSAPTPVIVNPPADAEFGRAQWDVGTQTWVAAGRDCLVVSYTRRGRWRLATVDLATGTLTGVADALDPREWLAADGTHVVFVGASATEAPSVSRIHLRTGDRETLRSASTETVPRGYLSEPEAISYPSSGGATVHAFYYPPANSDVSAPEGERPPLIAMSHGGPTTATSVALDLRVQFWTSRGFAVLDVNYGGSTGYGRAYRERLRGAWGVVDVDDVVAGVRHLVAGGLADPKRLIARGGSAGGYTTLAALTGHPDVFRAGASYYGVSDLEALARDTHKFESRYLDSLVGPYPEAREEYRRRSPVHFVDRLSCALIFLQGLEDRVVPPDQSALMADAVRRKGLPVAYLTFAGEQHGFRRAETIARCHDAELFFYGAVFGFEPAERIEPVAIDNL